MGLMVGAELGPAAEAGDGFGAAHAGAGGMRRLRRVVFSTLRSLEGGRAFGLEEGLAGLIDVHHVVAASIERAAPARALLSAWSVALDGPSNAAMLPRWFHQQHGLHRSSYIEGVNRRLVAADGMARRVRSRAGASEGRRLFRQALCAMGDALCFETGDVGAASLQAALRRCDPERVV